MILTGPELAQALEQAEATHLSRQVAACSQLRGYEQSRAIAICGGIAAVTDPAFGRKLNHVTGLGMGAAVNTDELAQLESLYAAQGLETQIDVCPHADGSTLAVLAERGYSVNAFSNTYVRALAPTDTYVAEHGGSGIEIITDRAFVEATFVSDSVAGFSVQAVSRPVVLLETLAQIALQRSDTLLFAATIDGKVAGTAGMSLIETASGLLAHLYIASTLPAYRGRGIQLALLRARLTAARNGGCTLAGVTARPANTSGRNTERAGFSLAYTKSTFIKTR
ncbi:Ribosomal protein S18 acetylase RimI [Collimonas sp. OK607]|uniref:GNAT family N-acetyltransferase n=1 Tax=Collimonas sp. OK607 TaxID=1798194 RepID=UPI0008E16AD3|nr:GNAT family N-acetyltransferase [Collimonas sp. OK607]SFB36193.1 Ribosomal protein S18 acetylase RimI [Collimonas sp. OK607]